MKKLLFILSLVLLAVTVAFVNTYAQEGAGAKVLEYSIVPASIPEDGSFMTKCDLDELKKDSCKTAYNFGKRIVDAGSVNVPANIKDAVDELAARFANLQLYTENLELHLDNDSSVSKVEILDNMDAGYTKIRSPIANSIGGSAENLVGSTTFAEKLDKLATNVEVINGHINSLWADHHGYPGIILTCSKSLSGEMNLIDSNGDIVDVNFVTIYGNVGGTQTVNTTQAYTLAGLLNGTYTILCDVDVSNGPTNHKSVGNPVLQTGVNYDIYFTPIASMADRDGVYKCLLHRGMPEEYIKFLLDGEDKERIVRESVNVNLTATHEKTGY